MLRERLRKLWNRWPYLKLFLLACDDQLQGLKMLVGQIGSDSGATHERLSVEKSVAYVIEVFNDYKRYGQIDRFEGITAEVGPGDNAGVALLIRNDGSQAVDLVDRYVSRRDSRQQNRIYEALSAKFGLDQFRVGPTWSEYELHGVTIHIGHSAEEYFSKCSATGRRKYDAIVSRSVLEHLVDPLMAITSMVRCLKPGGCMVHKVDLRDHGLFSPLWSELMFLQFPSSLYRWTRTHSGRPNRILFHRYRETLDQIKEEHDIESAFYVTQLVKVGELKPHILYEEISESLWQEAAVEVEKHRHSFAHEFQQIDGRDLAIAGFFLVVRKR